MVLAQTASQVVIRSSLPDPNWHLSGMLFTTLNQFLGIADFLLFPHFSLFPFSLQ